MKKQQKTNLEILFIMGVLFMPFDNLFFAPSLGWATIAPFFFFGYTLFNIEHIGRYFKKNTFLIIVFLLVLGFLRGLMYSSMSSVLETLGTITLGMCFYFSMCIYENAYGEKAGMMICKYLFIAYSASYIYGIISMIPAESVRNIFRLLEKRYYPRLHYSFTEPSFMSMHIFGVMLPFAIYYNDSRLKKLGIVFLITGLLFGNSARFTLDCLIVGMIIIAYYMFNKGVKYFLGFLIVLFVVIPCLYYYLTSGSNRLSTILMLGVYSDNSLAARWFRINAISHGFDLMHFLFGYGISNTWIPFNNGYNYAYEHYLNGYLIEVLAIKGTHSSSFFCMPLRIISEFGIIVFTYIGKKLFDKKYWYYLLIVFWLYTQFDSYAFYALWIYIFLIINSKTHNFDGR